MATCILHEIPDVVLRSIVHDWLRLRHLIHLDLALCRPALRNPTTILVSDKVTTLSMYLVEEKLHVYIPWGKDTLSCGVSADTTNRVSKKLPVVSWIQRLASLSFVRTSRECPSHNQLYRNITKWCPKLVSLELGAGSHKQTYSWDYCFRTLSQSCPLVTTLKMTSVRTSAAVFNAIRRWKHLTDLTIELPDQLLPVEALLPGLKALKTIWCEVTDSILVEVSRRCPNLETLHILDATCTMPSGSVTDYGVQAVLQGCPLLRDTDCEYATCITPALRVELARRRSLTTLQSTLWRYLTADVAVEILKASPGLRVLQCELCHWVDDRVLEVCAEYCPLLEQVVLNSCGEVTSRGMCCLIEARGRALRSVSLLHTPLSEVVVYTVARPCPALEEFHSAPGVSDAAIVELAHSCPHLRVVGLPDTMVGDSALSALAMHCRGLTSLALEGCHSITAQGLAILATHSANLVSLTLPDYLARQALALFPARVEVKSYC